MALIVHRRNSIKTLLATPKKYGVEIDIRSQNERLIISHDPFSDGEEFEEWLKYFSHGTLILNVKEEGLERRIIEILTRFNINNYFFLDQSFPSLIKFSSKGLRNCAVRVSEFEPIETALKLAEKVDWVWVDCFSHFPLSTLDFRKLREANFKVCIVSPELLGRSPEVEIPLLSKLLKSQLIDPDAICTKNPEVWEKCQSNQPKSK